MNCEMPWTSCFFTRMLILHLEQAGKDADVDYREILNSIAWLNRIEDPKLFLKDYNNWVPHQVLKNLILAAEKATGNEEFTYHASRNYFQPNRSHSILEIIIKLNNNIEQILLYSNLWAGGYTNYLKLQSLKPSLLDGTEIILLSQFGLNVEPSLGNIRLIRGNYEGFTKLFDYIEDAACIEEISQVKIETIIKEFEDYYIEKKGDQLSILKSFSKKEVITARRVSLRHETLSVSDNYPAAAEELIAHPKHGKVSVLSPQTETGLHHCTEGNAAYEIIRGGTLHNGHVKYTLQRGTFFNAPYSRYRYKWKSKAVPKASHEITRAQSEIIPLLFDHLRGLRETQRRQLLSTIEHKALAAAHENLKTVIQKEFDFFGIIGKSPRMQELFDQVQLVAQTDSTVLIMGETGTGKELFARAIHQAGPRRDRKFLAINCTALPENLLEAELFGYEKGAFTGALSQKKGIFESAHGGTLFLDEIGDISPSMQAKLLRVLEEQEIQRVGGRETISVDVRIISATNNDLKNLVAAGRFRNDLFYRIHVITLKVPPLRERIDDLLLLIEHYVDLFSRKCKKQKPAITRETLTILKNRHWTGNIRELRNIIERAVVLDRDQQITPEDITLLEEDQPSPGAAVTEPKVFHEAIENYKRSVIKEAIKKTGGNQTKAAQMLGLQRTYLVRLIRQLNIPKD